MGALDLDTDPLWAVVTFQVWANFFQKLIATFKFWTPEL
jgi:hypothetical protein